ncbi:MAG: flippase-like domain-containing protein [Sandaracinaceae bacterium]|nr:flippase-like domain-containing protein [Sandaracinaceae bacterium]
MTDARDEDGAPPPARASARDRAWMLVRALLGIAGIGVVVWLVREQGVDELARVITPALAWLPLAAALDVGRVAMDALSSRLTLGKRGADVPFWPLFTSHLVAYAVMGVSPAGRATSEAVKATLLSRWVGGATAAAMGTANQANVLLSSGAFTILSALAAYAVTGPSLLTALLVVHVVTMTASGVALRAAARWERVGAWLGARFPRLAPHASTFVGASRETELVAFGPVVAMMAGRGLQAAHFYVLAHAVGLDPSALGALALHGTYLVIAALGVLVPGQIGASEGGFALAANALGAAEAQAISIALLSHAVQLALVAVGFGLLALWPRRRPA